MLKSTTINSLSKIIFSVILFSGCTNQDNIIIPAPMIQNKSNQCINEQYKVGYTITGSLADSNANDRPLIISFDLGDKTCMIIALVQPNFEKQRIMTHFKSFECENIKIKRNGYVLDIDCEAGLNAKHIINQRAISYLKDQINRSKIVSPEVLKEYENVQKGYLEIEPNHKIFIAFE